MIPFRLVFAFAVLLQCSTAVLEFTSSKLFDEKDLAGGVFVDNNFCEPRGCRIFVSVPAASVDVAKKIMLKTYNDGIPDMSLYDISLLKDGDQKGCVEMPIGTHQIAFMNPGAVTAPMAVWVVQANIPDALESRVYDAANLHTAPAALLDVVTVMSAEPFTLRTKTQGKMISIATLSGYDGVYSDSGDECTNVVEQFDGDAYADVQVFVQSPLISLFFDSPDYMDTTVAFTAEVGNEKNTVNTFDFSGVSFVASPGFMCKGDKNYFSSLYGAATSFSYSKCGWLYDVDISTALNLDDNHQVTLKDNTNDLEYKWSGTDPEALTLQQTDNIDVTWTSDPNLSFLIRLTPSNAQQLGPEVICETITTPELVRMTTHSPDNTPDGTTAVTPDQPDHTDPPIPAKTTTSKPDQPDQPDHTDPPGPVKTTTAKSDEPDHPDHTDPPGPVKSTTAKSDQPDHTDPEPVKTTTTKPTTTASNPLKTVHPRYISSTMKTTLTPTTSGAPGYGLLCVLLALASVLVS